MHQQLQALQLDYQLFDAVDGHAEQQRLAQRVDKKAYRRNMGSQLLPGKMGVYASHLQVWQEFLNSSSDYALILEDDVVFHDDFHSALETAFTLSEHWDLVRFNCIRAKIPVTQATRNGYQLNAYVGPFTGNATYLIKRSTVEKLLPNMWPQTRALDHELNRYFLHNYRQLGLQPWSSHTDDQGLSTITGTHQSSVRKLHWKQRLPHFRLKAGNYLRRALWLLRRQMFGKTAAY